MTKIVIDIECEEKECGSCVWKRYLHPNSIVLLRCDLFNITLGHDYDENANLVGRRCEECLEREYKLQ